MSDIRYCENCREELPVEADVTNPFCWDCLWRYVGVCDFCGLWPAAGYLSRTEPQVIISCCEECLNYHSYEFEGF